MKPETEERISRMTTVTLAAAVTLCLTAFILDLILDVSKFEFVFGWIAGLVMIGVIGCVLAGWWAAIQYMMSRSRAPAAPAEYLLLVVAVFMPIAAIYVLRSIRRRQAQEVNRTSQPKHGEDQRAT